MENLPNNNKFYQSFLNHLAGLGVSSQSIKHYKSDLSHFTGWILFKLRSLGVYGEELKEAIPFLIWRRIKRGNSLPEHQNCFRIQRVYGQESKSYQDNKPQALYPSAFIPLFSLDSIDRFGFYAGRI